MKPSERCIAKEQRNLVNEAFRIVLRIVLCFIFISGTAFAAPPVPFFFGVPQEGTAPLTVLFTATSDGDVNTWLWDFGDGTTSRQKGPMHQYTDPGYYSVTLTISGPQGANTITRLGYIFVSKPSLQEENDISPLVFTNQYENGFILDDTSDNDQNQEKSERPIPNTPDLITPVPAARDPTPSLKAAELVSTEFDPALYAPLRDSTEKSADESTIIPATGPMVPPRAIFTVDPVEGRSPLTVTFVDTSTGSVKERIWSFGDKTESTKPIVEHTYTKAGRYPVSLTVIGYDGTMHRSAGFITVFPPSSAPVPKIACSTTEALKIICEATVSSGAEDLSLVWKFGDGKGGTGQRVTHTYEAPGTYMVSVTAADVYKQTGVDSMQLELKLPPLDATFTYEIDAQDPMTVTFTGNKDENSWKWEFGDGKGGTGQSVTHTYKAPGTYMVSVTATDVYKQTGVDSMQLELKLPLLDATFTYEIDAQDPMTVTFTGSKDAKSWKWDFGDGKGGTGQSVTHTYTMIGEVDVTLTIVDAYQERQLSKRLPMHVPPIDVDFAISLSDPQEPYTVSFLDRSYGPITTWQWDFGDGKESKEQNPVHTYNQSGEYAAQLIITSEYGDTKTQQVRFIIPEQGNGNVSTMSDGKYH